MSDITRRVVLIIIYQISILGGAAAEVECVGVCVCVSGGGVGGDF